MGLEAHPELTTRVIYGLGWLYLILFGMNAVWTLGRMKRGEHSRWLQQLTGRKIPAAMTWGAYSAVLFAVSMTHFVGAGRPHEFLIRMPDGVKDTINLFADPVSYFTLSTVVFVAMIVLRKWWIRPTVAWTLLNAALLFMTLSMTDYDFRQIVGKPDNVPIVSMLFIVSFFSWVYFTRAVDNDIRREEGRPLFEEEDNEKVLVWPDLVYIELICMVALTALLVFWGIALQAPLEEAASLVKTPNPSKAPWYFLGLQEMLVYYDPWLAGVVFPSFIIVGLMAIPYIDFNKKGCGYYTFNERPFAVVTFMFGFLPLWIATIILGTFLRGPNWNFFGIYEFWDVHKLKALTNVNLSEYVWIYSPLSGLFGGLPTADAHASTASQVGMILVRESVGIIAVLVYFLVLPPLLAGTLFRKFYARMGFIRYMVFANLLLWMAALPIKMVLRWSINLKYVVAIPEWFFNI